MLTRRRGYLAVVLTCSACFKPLPTAAENALHFGDWFLGDFRQLFNELAPSYFIRNHLVADDNRSPSLQIVCTGANYRLNFFPGSAVTGGPYNLIVISIDRRNRIGLVAEVQNIGQFGVLEAELTDKDLNRIGAVQSVLVVTSPGLKTTFEFKGYQTDKAISALRASCQP